MTRATATMHCCYHFCITSATPASNLQITCHTYGTHPATHLQHIQHLPGMTASNCTSIETNQKVTRRVQRQIYFLARAIAFNLRFKALPRALLGGTYGLQCTPKCKALLKELDGLGDSATEMANS